MTATTKRWRESLLRTMCTDVAMEAAGVVLDCDDAARLATAVAAAGSPVGGVRAWCGHLQGHDAEHATLHLERPAAVGVRAVDAVIRELGRPQALAAVASTLACDQVDVAVSAVWLLDARAMLSYELLVSHAPYCPDRHAGVKHWTDARPVVLDAVERVTRDGESRD